MKPATVILYLLCSLTPLRGDGFRALVVDQIHLRVQPEFEQTAELSLEEMASVTLEGDSRFLQGLRIELVVSNQLKAYYDSFGLVVYKSVRPEPAADRRAYTGERAFLHYLPYLNRVYVTVPVGQPLPEAGPAQMGSFTVEPPLDPAEFPLLVGVVPLMKGVPDSVVGRKFFLTVRPVVEKRGLVELTVRYPPGMSPGRLALTIDGIAAELPGGPLEMEAGVHQLHVEGPGLKEVNAAFSVESGKTTPVLVQLEASQGALFLEAPLGAEIFLDGQKVPWVRGAGVPLLEGQHTLRVTIGDYSLSKRFTARPGKDYHISCVFDIIVTED